MNLYRSHNCGELNLNHIDKDVHISGWVNKKRDHGGLLFIDLRDEYGITQCVVNSDNSKFKILESLKLESVIKISGKVIRRSDDTIKVSGKRIGPSELESVIIKSGKAKEVAAVGVPDEKKGSKIILSVVLIDGDKNLKETVFSDLIIKDFDEL